MACAINREDNNYTLVEKYLGKEIADTLALNSPNKTIAITQTEQGSKSELYSKLKESYGEEHAVKMKVQTLDKSFKDAHKGLIKYKDGEPTLNSLYDIGLTRYGGKNTVERHNVTQEENEKFNSYVHHLNRNLGANIVMDNTIGEAQLDPLFPGSKPTIRFNPNNLNNELPFHEFGHLFLEIQGGLSNPDIVSAYDTVKDTAIYDEVKQKYNLDNDAFKKEVVATALGKKGLELFEDGYRATWWDSFKNRFFKNVRQMLGLPVDYIEYLAKETIGVKQPSSWNLDVNYVQQSREAVKNSKSVTDTINIFKQWNTADRTTTDTHYLINGIPHSRITKYRDDKKGWSFRGDPTIYEAERQWGNWADHILDSVLAASTYDEATKTTVLPNNLKEIIDDLRVKEIDDTNFNFVSLSDQMIENIFNDTLDLIEFMDKKGYYLMPQVFISNSDFALAGTADIIAISKDNPQSIAVFDLKTSKKPVWNINYLEEYEGGNSKANQHRLQLNSYGYMLKEAGFNIKELGIIPFRAEFTKDSVTNKKLVTNIRWDNGINTFDTTNDVAEDTIPSQPVMPHNILKEDNEDMKLLFPVEARKSLEPLLEAVKATKKNIYGVREHFKKEKELNKMDDEELLQLTEDISRAVTDASLNEEIAQLLTDFQVAYDLLTSRISANAKWDEVFKDTFNYDASDLEYMMKFVQSFSGLQHIKDIFTNEPDANKHLMNFLPIIDSTINKYNNISTTVAELNRAMWVKNFAMKSGRVEEKMRKIFETQFHDLQASEGRTKRDAAYLQDMMNYINTQIAENKDDIARQEYEYADKLLHDDTLNISSLSMWANAPTDVKDDIVQVMSELFELSDLKTRNEYNPTHNRFLKGIKDILGDRVTGKPTEIYNGVLERNSKGELTGRLKGFFNSEFLDERKALLDVYRNIDDKSSMDAFDAFKQYSDWMKNNNEGEFTQAFYDKLEAISGPYEYTKNKYLLKQLLSEYRSLDTGEIDWKAIPDVKWKAIKALKQPEVTAPISKEEAAKRKKKRNELYASFPTAEMLQLTDNFLGRFANGQIELDELLNRVDSITYKFNAAKAKEIYEKNGIDALANFIKKNKFVFSEMVARNPEHYNIFKEDTTIGDVTYKKGDSKKGLPKFDKWKSKDFNNITGTDKQLFDLFTNLNKLKNKNFGISENLKLDKDKGFGEKLPSIGASGLEMFVEKGAAATFNEMKDRFHKVRSDDLEHMGQEEVKPDEVQKDIRTVTDITGEKKKFIPVYYRGALREGETQSYDLPTIFLMDLYSSINFKNKRDMEFTSLIAKDIIYERGVAEKTHSGNKYIDWITGKSIKTDNNALKVIEGMIDRRLYGIKSYSDPKIKKIVTSIQSYVSATFLSLNLKNFITNFLQGNTASFLEAVGGHVINKNNFLKGIKLYSNDYTNIARDVNAAYASSKTNLLIEKFNVFGDHNAIRRTLLDTSKLAQIVDRQNLSFGSEIGEHQIQATLMYAVMDAYKVKDVKGNEIPLYEAYEVRDGELKVIDGVKVTEQDELRVLSMTKNIIRMSQGNYHTENTSLMRQFISGNMVENLKKFVVTNFHNAFSGISNIRGLYKNKGDKANWLSEWDYDTTLFNQETKSFHVGYLADTARVLGALYLDWKNETFGKGMFTNISGRWHRLDNDAQGNIKKTASSLITVAGFAMFASFMYALSKQAPDEEGLLTQENALLTLTYFSKRLSKEMSFVYNPMELLRLWDSPVAAISGVVNIAELAYQGMVELLPDGFLYWELDRYQSGRRYGDSKIWHRFSDVIPVLNQMNSPIKESTDLLFK